MQAAHLGDQLVAGAQVEVVGVAKDDLSVELLEQVLRDGLDGSGRADRHERWGLNETVGEGYGRPPRLPAGSFYLKSERHSGDSSWFALNLKRIADPSAPVGMTREEGWLVLYRLATRTGAS